MTGTAPTVATPSPDSAAPAREARPKLIPSRALACSRRPFSTREGIREGKPARLIIFRSPYTAATRYSWTSVTEPNSAVTGIEAKTAPRTTLSRAITTRRSNRSRTQPTARPPTATGAVYSAARTARFPRAGPRHSETKAIQLAASPAAETVNPTQTRRNGRTARGVLPDTSTLRGIERAKEADRCGAFHLMLIATRDNRTRSPTVNSDPTVTPW